MAVLLHPMGYGLEAKEHLLRSGIESAVAKKVGIGQHVTGAFIPSRHALELHINRNLKDVEGDTALTYGRNLVQAIKKDLALLASLLVYEEDFKNIEQIEGTAMFSEQQGARLGFQSELVSVPNLQSLVYQLLSPLAIGAKRVRGASFRPKETRHFHITRDEFIERYYNPGIGIMVSDKKSK